MLLDSVPTSYYHTFCLKDNIALIAVLEAKFGNQGTENPGKRQLLCVVRQSPFFLQMCIK